MKLISFGSSILPWVIALEIAVIRAVAESQSKSHTCSPEKCVKGRLTQGKSHSLPNLPRLSHAVILLCSGCSYIPSINPPIPRHLLIQNIERLGRPLAKDHVYNSKTWRRHRRVESGRTENRFRKHLSSSSQGFIGGFEHGRLRGMGDSGQPTSRCPVV